MGKRIEGNRPNPKDVEAEFATEIYKNIVLHSRLDLLARKHATIVDFKTQKKGAGGARIYKNSKQLPTYAWHLALHNIRIKHVVYLVEIWEMDAEGNPDRVVGYEKFVKIWAWQIRIILRLGYVAGVKRLPKVCESQEFGKIDLEDFAIKYTHGSFRNR